MTLLQVVGGARRYFGAPSVAVFLSILAAISCKKTDAGAVAPAPAAPAPDPRAGLPQGATLDGQLAAEAAGRLKDTETISFEQLAASLQPVGIAFGPARQVMARPHLAIYCARADGPEGIEVTVCEYPSAEAAKNGELESNKVLGQAPGHASRVRKKSVLHMLRKSSTAPATVEKIVEAFNAA